MKTLLEVSAMLQESVLEAESERCQRDRMEGSDEAYALAYGRALGTVTAIVKVALRDLEGIREAWEKDRIELGEFRAAEAEASRNLTVVGDAHPVSPLRVVS